MKDSLFQSYSRKHVHFYGRDILPLLESALTLVNNSVKKFSMLDLGCGDGKLIFALYEKGLFKNAEKIVGVDISKDRIERLKTGLPFVRGIVADALNVKELPDSSFDFVVCAQLIEHVENEQALMSEIRRLLKRRGLAYVSSVIKRWWGVYVYFKKGSFRLDPTHVREYSSEREFLDVMADEGVEIVKVETRPVRFPVPDLVARLSIQGGLAEPDAGFYEKHKNLSRLRKLQLAVIGYDIVEALVRKL
jgi:2-polyprenyl-3-methyl-5-hydroxy-6-metoxy-1,4-benzoquinol methylase